MTEEERRIVEEAFKAAAGEYGYDARVEWEEESDLKVKWMRAGGSITFHLCDYLDDMPAEAAEAHLGTHVCPEVAWGRDIGERGSMGSSLFNAVIVDERLRDAPPDLLRFVAAKGLAYLDQDDLFADFSTREEHVDRVLERVYTNAQIEDLTRRAAELVDDGYEDDEEYEEDEE